MTQWQGLLQNLGIWQGSFTQLSLDGTEIQDIPSEVTLSLSEDEQTVHFRLKRFPDGEAPNEMTLQIQYPGPGPGVPFFEDGCFSQGSLQWSTWTPFGNELALVEGNRRLRLVQLYQQSDLSKLTLIRESRTGSQALTSPPLSVEDLIGDWVGQATTLYPDGRVIAAVATRLSMQREDDRLEQTFQCERQTTFASARIDGNCLHFEDSPQPLQMLCLPGGASSLCPPQIQPQTPFVVEAGWLIGPTYRKRLLRHYGAQGEWMSITLVTERKAKGT